MRLYVTATPTDIDVLPTGTAGSIARQYATDAGLNGSSFTLKVDGVLLDPGNRPPKTCNVVEVVEWTSGTTEAVDVEPAAEPAPA